MVGLFCAVRKVNNTLSAHVLPSLKLTIFRLNTLYSLGETAISLDNPLPEIEHP